MNIRMFIISLFFVKFTYYANIMVFKLIKLIQVSRYVYKPIYRYSIYFIYVNGKT